jgi:hypothetical protein
MPRSHRGSPRGLDFQSLSPMSRETHHRVHTQLGLSFDTLAWDDCAHGGVIHSTTRRTHGPTRAPLG